MRTWIIAAAGLVVVTAISLPVYYNSFSNTENPPAQPAPVQRNLTWQREAQSLKAKAAQATEASSNNSPGGIFVRLEENKDGNLLVKFTDPQEFYRYDGETKTIAASSEAEWLAGKQEIACRDREYNEKQFVEIDEAAKTLHFRGKGQIPAYGAFALDALESPKKNLAAVLSAAGPRGKASPGFIFGGQSGQILGQRYVQILNLASAAYVTEPLGLMKINEFPNYWFCWTDNEKFVLAYEVEYTNTKRFEMDFHVIETNR